MDGKKAWKQLWLAYGKKKDLGNGKYFENVWLKGFDAEDRMVNSALQELKLGAEGMLGITPQVKQVEVAPNGDKCLAETAANF